MRMLLSNVCTDGGQRPGGNNDSSKWVKRSVTLDHLLREPKAVLQEFFELVRIYSECGHAV